MNEGTKEEGQGSSSVKRAKVAGISRAKRESGFSWRVDGHSFSISRVCVLIFHLASPLLFSKPLSKFSHLCTGKFRRPPLAK